MDFFEWAGLYELREVIIERIRRIEQALWKSEIQSDKPMACAHS